MRKEFGISQELKRSLTIATVLATIVGAVLLVQGIFQHSGDPITRILSVVGGMSMLLVAWINVEITRTNRLILTPESLEFHSPGLVLTTPWDNLERIGKVAAYDSLVLRTPAIQKTAWWFKLFRKRPEREIPMSMFSKWRTSELGQEIRKYAPHLF